MWHLLEFSISPHLLCEQGLLAHHGVSDDVHAQLPHPARHNLGDALVRLNRLSLLTLLRQRLYLDAWWSPGQPGILWGMLLTTDNSLDWQGFWTAALGLLPLVSILCRSLMHCLLLVLMLLGHIHEQQADFWKPPLQRTLAWALRAARRENCGDNCALAACAHHFASLHVDRELITQVRVK